MTPDFRITQTLHCSFSQRPFDQFRQALCCCNKIKQTNKNQLSSLRQNNSLLVLYRQVMEL